MEAWIRSLGRALFQCPFCSQCRAGLCSARLSCNSSAPILFSRDNRKMTNISTVLPTLFWNRTLLSVSNIFQGLQMGLSLMDSQCFFSWILLCWWSAENLWRGHPLGHSLKATKWACNRKRKPFQNMAPPLIRLVVLWVQKYPVCSQTPTSHLWARGHRHAARELNEWKECKFVP